MHHDTIRHATTRHDTMPRETIRNDADTIWIRYGYGATRYDTLARDNNGSPPPDRVREPIKLFGTLLGPLRATAVKIITTSKSHML